MSAIKGKVLKFEKKLDSVRKLDVRNLTPEQIHALDVRLLSEEQIDAIGMSNLSDEQLDDLKHYLATDEGIEWLESLTGEELRALKHGDMLPPVA